MACIPEHETGDFRQGKRFIARLNNTGISSGGRLAHKRKKKQLLSLSGAEKGNFAPLLVPRSIVVPKVILLSSVVAVETFLQGKKKPTWSF